MADLSRPDLCIVGAGALGIALAQHARTLGSSVLLVDRGAPEPGDGPQDGLHLAALQASAARAHAIRTAGSFGVAGANPKVSMRAVQERALELVHEQAPEVSRDRLTALGIDIIRGNAGFTDPNTLLVGDLQIKPRSIVLAVGARSRIPDLPGLGDIAFFTPDTIFDNSRKLSHLLVVGGDATGLVLAQAFARLGSDVTVVPQGRVLAGYDQECVDILLSTLRAEGVRIIDGGTIKEFRPRAQGIGAVAVLSDSSEVALDLSHVLLADGRLADVEALGPVQANLHVQANRHFATGRSGQTSNRRIRVVGPAAGIDQWQYALRHGRAVIEELVTGRAAHLAPQPLLVATEPGLAQVGQEHGNGDKARPAQRLRRESFVENEQARAYSTVPGLVKVTTAENGHITGASMVGPGAAELVSVFALGMQKGLALRELAGLALPAASFMTVLTRLGEKDSVNQSPSAWDRRRRALRRVLPF